MYLWRHCPLLNQTLSVVKGTGAAVTIKFLIGFCKAVCLGADHPVVLEAAADLPPTVGQSRTVHAIENLVKKRVNITGLSEIATRMQIIAKITGIQIIVVATEIHLLLQRMDQIVHTVLSKDTVILFYKQSQ